MRYLDLIMNERTRKTFIMRNKVIGFVRKYLNSLNFMEVYKIFNNNNNKRSKHQ